MSLSARHWVSRECPTLASTCPRSWISLHPVSGVQVAADPAFTQPKAQTAPLFALAKAARVAVTVATVPVRLAFVAVFELTAFAPLLPPVSTPSNSKTDQRIFAWVFVVVIVNAPVLGLDDIARHRLTVAPVAVSPRSTTFANVRPAPEIPLGAAWFASVRAVFLTAITTSRFAVGEMLAVVYELAFVRFEPLVRADCVIAIYSPPPPRRPSRRAAEFRRSGAGPSTSRSSASSA